MRDVIDVRKLDPDKYRTRNGGLGFHDAALAISSVWPMPDTFHIAPTAGRRIAKRDILKWSNGQLSGFAKRIHFAPPRRNGAAAFMDGARLDDKALLFQQKVKVLEHRCLLGVNPDDQYPA